MSESFGAAIPVLVYDDVESALQFIVEVFGLVPGDISRDEAGVVVHAEASIGGSVIWLHLASNDFRLASPRTAGCDTACAAIVVDDIDAHYSRSVEHDAQIVYEPTDMPYGLREYSARDLEGRMWSFVSFPSPVNAAW